MIFGFTALSAGAQTLLPGKTALSIVSQKLDPGRINGSPVRHNGNRTTSGTSGWFDYISYLDSIVADSNSGISKMSLWNDTSAIINGGYNRVVSYANTLDPTFPGFSTYFGLPVITAADPYTLDSLVLYGVYGINPAKTGVVDTLKVGYVYGPSYVLDTSLDIPLGYFTNPTLLSTYGVASTDSLFFPLCKYDSADNTGKGTTYHEQILTISTAASSNTNINWGDTLSSGIMFHPFAFDVPAAVPAGNLIAITVSFKSGDASFSPGDTVYIAPGTYKYNMFCPLLSWHEDPAGTTLIYDPANKNTGYLKTLPNFENGWKDWYIPMWAWGAYSPPTLRSLRWVFTCVLPLLLV